MVLTTVDAKDMVLTNVLDLLPGGDVHFNLDYLRKTCAFSLTCK